MPGANSLFALSFVGAMAIGPAIGSWIMLAHGARIVFFVDAFTFLVPALAVGPLMLPDDRPPRPPLQRSVWADLGEGLRHARSEPGVRTALASIAGSFLVIGAMSVCGVVVVKELGCESARFGTLMSALGVGMVTGAALSVRVARRLPPASVALMGLVFMAVAVAAMPWSGSLGIATGLSALIGLGMILVQVSAQTVLQTSNPAMRGRLMGLSQTLTGGVSFLSSALVGLALEELKVQLVMGSVGALVLSVALLSLGRRRRNQQERGI